MTAPVYPTGNPPLLTVQLRWAFLSPPQPPLSILLASPNPVHHPQIGWGKKQGFCIPALSE